MDFRYPGDRWRTERPRLARYEPSSGLSPLLTERMLEEVKSLKHRFGCTVLLIEQNVKNAVAISDRVLILRRGRIDYEFLVTPQANIGSLLDAYSFKGH